MKSSTLAARICTLTQIIDDLEIMDRDLGRIEPEIAALHSLIDQLNLDYESTRTCQNFS